MRYTHYQRNYPTLAEFVSNGRLGLSDKEKAIIISQFLQKFRDEFQTELDFRETVKSYLDAGL